MEFKDIEYEDKSESKLILENQTLRKKIKDLENSLKEKSIPSHTYDKLEHELLERVKELNCLFSTIKLIEKEGISLSTLFKKAVTFIPPAFQYPEITCTRIIFGVDEYLTENFKETKWKLSTDIIVSEHKAGSIDVFYLEEKPQLYEGPFLKDERSLLDTLGNQLGSMIERKITEGTLSDNEKRLKSIFEAADNVSFILTDLEGKDARILEFSPGSENIFGYKRDEVIGKPVSILHLPEDVEKFPEFFNIMKQKKKGFSGESTLIRKNGEKFQALFTMHPILDSNDNIAVALGVSIDITELKKAQEEMQESKETATALINAPLDLMMLVDRNYNVLMINKIAAKSFNLKVDTLIGKSIFDYLPMKLVKTRKAAAEEVFKTAQPKYIKDERNGNIFENSIYPVFDSKGNVNRLAIYARNITEKEKNERDIKNSREQLRNLSSHLQTIREEERASIAREIHDDLGQLLAVVKINISEIEKSMPKRKKDEIKKINTIKKLLDSANESIYKIASELRPSILDDLGLSAAIEWQAKEFHKNTGIKCNVKSKPVEIVLNEKLSIAIYRIIQEALTNVTRHSRARMVDIDIIVQNKNLNLAIKDNGVGIKEEKINNPKSFGLIGIRERLVPWKGTVKINGIKDEGTTIIVNVPFEEK